MLVHKKSPIIMEPRSGRRKLSFDMSLQKINNNKNRFRFEHTRPRLLAAFIPSDTDIIISDRPTQPFRFRNFTEFRTSNNILCDMVHTFGGNSWPCEPSSSLPRQAAPTKTRKLSPSLQRRPAAPHPKTTVWPYNIFYHVYLYCVPFHQSKHQSGYPPPPLSLIRHPLPSKCV